MLEKNSNKFFSVFLVCVLVISGLSVTATLGVKSEESSDEKVVLIKDFEGELDIEELKNRGEVLDSYGNFILFKSTERELSGLSRQYEIDRLEHKNELNVKGYEFDTSEGYPDLEEELTIDSYKPGTEGLYIVDMIAPVNPEWTTELESKGVELINPVPNYAFEAQMTPKQAKEVEELFFVDRVVIYQPEFKLADDLEPGLVNVLLAEGASGETLNSLSQATKVLSVKNLPTYGTQVSAEVKEVSTFSELANLKDVYYISNQIKPELQGEVSTQTIGGGNWIWDPDNDPHTPWRGPDNEYEYGAHVNHLGYEGEGVTVAVADTGLLDTHPDFQNRVIGGLSYTQDGNWSDDHGHGTHCAGSVAADTYHGTGDTVDDHWDTNVTDYYVAQGMAPKSELFAQKIFKGGQDFVAPTDPYSQIITDAREKSGAYIHSNSWGAPTEGNYTPADRDYDSIIRDAGDGEPMIITVAAGNNGQNDDTGDPVYQSTGSPGNAKNVITVGGSEAFYPGLAESADMYEADPDRTFVASSRGWTEDGRIKPDVMAPGLYVFSTYVGENDPSKPSYGGLGGTSMANPAVAGASSLVVEWYEENYGERPSPAMVKGLLINTAYEMEPQPGDFYTGHIPNRDEGWGIVNLPALMDAESEFLLQDQTSLLQTGDVDEHNISYGDSSEPLKISLTWTDKEAQVDDGSTLKNDLNLQVEAPDGTTYRGNAFDQSWTQPGTDTMDTFDDSGNGWDDTNNVENVYIHPDNLQEGDYKIRVIGENIVADSNNDGKNNQDYSLVTYNVDPAAAPQINLESPTGGEYWQFGENREINWNTDVGDGTVTGVDLEYSLDGGDNWNLIAEGLAATGNYTWGIPEEPTDEALVRATVSDDMGFQSAENSSEFIITQISSAEPQPKDGEDPVGIDANLSVRAEHAGFGNDSGNLHNSDDLLVQKDIDSTDLSENDPLSEEDWRWLYNGNWRDKPDVGLGMGQDSTWYGAIRLDLSADTGKFLTNVSAFVFAEEAEYIQGHVGKDNNGAPVAFEGSSEKIGVNEDGWVEMDLKSDVLIEEPGEYWVILEVAEVKTSRDNLPLGAFETFVEDGGFLMGESGDPLNPDHWQELKDQNIDYSWALEGKVQEKATHFEVEMDHKSWINAGEELVVNYSVVNEGYQESTQDIEFTVVNEEGKEVYNDVIKEKLTLGGDEEITDDYKWTPNQRGEYDIKVSSEDSVDSGQIFVKDPSNFQIDIMDHPEKVVDGQEVSLEYKAKNEGTDEGTQEIEFTVKNTAEELVFQDTEEVTLGVDVEHQGEFTWAAEEPGNYVLKVASFDDKGEVTVSVELGLDVTFYDASDDSEIATASGVASGERANVSWENLEYGTTYQWYVKVDDGFIPDPQQSDTWEFTTEPNSNFEVDIVDIDDKIMEGKEATVSYTVTNTGESQDDQPIEFIVDGNVVATEENVNLAAGEEYEGEFTWTPEEKGDHSLEISTQDDLASRQYTVLEAPYFEVEFGDHAEKLAAGGNISVDYSVTNTGETTGTQEIEFLVEGSQEATQEVELAADEEYEGNFTWQTEEGDIGGHQLKIASEDSEVESSVELVEPPSFEIDILTEAKSIVEGDTLTLEYEVSNAGDIEDQQTMEFIVDGELQDSKEITLESGETKGDFFVWQTEVGDSGEYDLQISSDTRERGMTVNVLEDAFFEVEILSPIGGEEFPEGEEITIEYEVRNTGGVEATETIELTVNGEVKDSQEVTIGGGEVQEGEFTWTTEEGDSGDYDLGVESADDEDTKSDAFTVFEESTSGSFLDSWWWILPILVIAIILVIVIVAWKRKGGEEEEDICPDCGSEMRFIDDYDRWYCDSCEDYKSAPSGGTSGAVGTAGVADQQEQDSNACPDCGSGMRFIDDYDRWYCDSCEDYKSAQSTGGAEKEQEQDSNVCPDCGSEMRFIDDYDRWYCDSCEDYKSAPSGGTSGAVGTAGVADQQEQDSNACPDCGSGMRFIDDYDRWYCDSCEDYKSAQSTGGAEKEQEQDSNVCPDCGSEMRFIDDYDRWYCDNCEEYQ